MKISPYDFQLADIADLELHDMTGAIVAETGAGKTVIAAGAMRRSGVPTKLIIAPQGTLKDVWEATITGHTDLETGEWVEGMDPGARVQRIDGSVKGKQALDDLEWKEPGYYLMTPQIFTRYKPLHLRPDMTVVDEAHLLGNRSKPGGQTLMNFQSGHRIAMSGTLARNRFENLWTILRWLYPKNSESGDFADVAVNRWIDRYCETEYDRFAPGQRRVVGELYPGTIAGLVPCWRQHFKRAECCEFHPEGFLKDVAEPIVIRETVQLTSGQKNAIKQAQRDYLFYLDLATEEWQALPLEERKKKPLVMKLPIVRETRLSQMTLAMPSMIPQVWSRKPRQIQAFKRAELRAPSSVLPAEFAERFMRIFYNIDEWEGVKGIDWIDGSDGVKQKIDKDGMPLWDVIFAPDADSPKLDALVRIYKKVQEPVVAATNSQKFAELAVNRLNAQGIRSFEWSGDFTQKQRDQAKLDLSTGKLDMIVGVTSAIGTGIDGLQHASSVLVSLNKSRDLADETQLEGRLDRRGQREEGIVHYEIVAEGSTDEEVYDEQLVRRLKLNRSLRKSLNRNGDQHDRREQRDTDPQVGNSPARPGFTRPARV